jgi:anti-anti-sigma regulatory factor
MSNAIPGTEISVVGEPPVVVVSVIGHIPPEELSRAEDAYRKLIGPGRSRFLLDLSRADRVSSRGVGVVLYYHMLLSKSGGRLAVVRGNPEIMRKIGSFISPVLPVVATRAEGLALLAAAEPSAVAKT